MNGTEDIERVEQLYSIISNRQLPDDKVNMVLAYHGLLGNFFKN